MRPAIPARAPGSVGTVLKLGHRTFADTDLLVMAIVNRTRDSFVESGNTEVASKLV